MAVFHYANPGTIHWGAGCAREAIPAELERLGAHRVLLVTSRSPTQDPSLAPAVEALVGERLVGRYSEVTQHAPAESIAAAVALARELRPDALVSLGGGSPIDTAKAVAFSLASGIDLSVPEAAAHARRMKLPHALPHIAVPTTLSVAELSWSAGFTDAGSGEKVGVAAPELLAAAVVYDAELAVRTPLSLWLSSGIRAVDHAVETVFAPGDHPLADALALDGLRRLAAGLIAAHARPADTAARTECQLGAWFSYLLPGPAARGLSHTLGKRLGARHGIPHGVTSCLLLPHVIRYLAPRMPEKASRIAAALGAHNAAAAVGGLVARLGLPQHLSAWKLSDADLREAVRPVAEPDLPEEDLLAILRAAL